MSTRERSRRASSLDDDVTQDEIEAFMFEREAEAEGGRSTSGGYLNLQTGAGIALLLVGALYSLQAMGLLPLGLDMTGLASTLPWLAAVLILLTGLGRFARTPSQRRQEKARARAAKARARADRMRRSDGSTAYAQAERLYDRAREATSKAYSRSGLRAKRRLAKRSRDKKVSGVAGGIADYFGIDATLVRVLFVLGTIFGSGAAIVLYIVLAFALPSQDDDPVIRISDD